MLISKEIDEANKLIIQASQSRLPVKTMVMVISLSRVKKGRDVQNNKFRVVQGVNKRFKNELIEYSLMY